MSHSVYLHIPFCKQRCSYCDFNTYTGMESIIPDYVDALYSEIQYLADLSEARLDVHTIYFGGGTPSLLSVRNVEQILASLEECYLLQPDLEVTLEANPGTLTLKQLQDLHDLGVNRLSLGMQSANPDELRLLGRIHSYAEVVQSVLWARQAGFENLNLDLIFGLPGQSQERWKHNLNQALNLEPEHFSLYALTLEKGTPIERLIKQGAIPEPDPDLVAEMYEWAEEKLESNDYAQYEISNWARSEKEAPPHPFMAEEPIACRHNLQYWRNLPYLGFGAGAHGYAGGVRTANVLSPVIYIQCFRNGQLPTTGSLQPSRFPETPATLEKKLIEPEVEMGETMMMGLRLTQEGVSKQVFYQRFGLRLEEIYEKQIQHLNNQGLLEWSGKDEEVLRLTPRGRLLGNRVFVEFI